MAFLYIYIFSGFLLVNSVYRAANAGLLVNNVA